MRVDLNEFPRGSELNLQGIIVRARTDEQGRPYVDIPDERQAHLVRSLHGVVPPAAEPEPDEAAPRAAQRRRK